MTTEDFALAPAPMEGAGAYNRNSGVQRAGASPALPLLREAAERAGLAPAPEPVVIADYGASQGRSSFAPMRAAIDVLRRRVGPDRSVAVVHNDLPASDFSALFAALEGDPESYLRGDPACYASAVGRSFYGPVLPPASVTLGWSAWAVQWLSRAPAPIPDQVQVAYSADAAVRALYARQAADDWALFLASRSRELRPGGRLVVLTMALDADGGFGYRPVLVALHDCLRALRAEGFLGEGEFRAMAIPTVGRSHDDLARPFAGGTFAGLRLEHLEVFDGPDPIWDDFAGGGDSTAWGARWAAFSRASVLPTLAGALAGDPERVRLFLDRVEAGMAERLAAAPARFPIPLATVVASREG